MYGPELRMPVPSEGEGMSALSILKARVAELERHFHGNTDAHCDYCGFNSKAPGAYLPPSRGRRAKG